MDGDQLVIYQALAAFAQIGIILAAVFAVKGFLGVLDRFGVIANKAGKGLIDRAGKKGQEIKGNSAWQRGKDTRKATKKARKDENFARSPIRRNIAGGIPITRGQREARAAVLRNADRTVRHHESEEAGIIAEQLRRAGTTSDLELETIARGGGANNEGHSAAGRRAAMSLLAENGRVAALRRLQAGQAANPARGIDAVPPIDSDEDQQSLREIITGNSGRIYGKAPDLNPGNNNPFAGVSAEDVAGWHNTTLAEALASPQRNNVREAFDEAIQNRTLSGKIDRDMITAYQDAFGVPPPVAAAALPAGGAAGGGGPGVLNVPHGVPPIVPPPPGTAPVNPGNATPTQPVAQQRAAGGNLHGGPTANLPPTPPPTPPPGGGTPPPAGP